MDLTKTRMQLMPKGTSPIAVAKNIIAQDGAKGLYAGYVCCIGVGPLLSAQPDKQLTHHYLQP